MSCLSTSGSSIDCAARCRIFVDAPAVTSRAIAGTSWAAMAASSAFSSATARVRSGTAGSAGTFGAVRGGSDRGTEAGLCGGGGALRNKRVNRDIVDLAAFRAGPRILPAPAQRCWVLPVLESLLHVLGLGLEIIQIRGE